MKHAINYVFSHNSLMLAEQRISGGSLSPADCNKLGASYGGVKKRHLHHYDSLNLNIICWRTGWRGRCFTIQSPCKLLGDYYKVIL